MSNKQLKLLIREILIQEFNTIASGNVVGFTLPLGMDLSSIHKAFWSGDEPEKKTTKKKRLKEYIKQIVQEEFLGKKQGVRYYQMGGSIKRTGLYNKDKSGKATRDPGVAGLSSKTTKNTSEPLEKERDKKKRWYTNESKKATSYFKLGDKILFGKYKNKKGKIVSWEEDEHGNPNIEIEQTPSKATGRKKKNKVMGLYKIWHDKNKEKLKEAAMQVNEFDQATNLWFYECPGGGEVPEKVLDVLEKHAIPVYKKLAKSRWPTDCGEASDIWDKVFKKNGLTSQQVLGYYNPDQEPGMSQPGSTDHVWLEVEGCVFDPTAGQFKEHISLKNYWLDDSRRAYAR